MTDNTIVYVSNPYYYDLYKMIVKNIYMLILNLVKIGTVLQIREHYLLIMIKLMKR